MTSDDQKVVAGVFEMVDTHGVPLSFVLSGYQDRGLMPDWIAFYEKALKAGWKPQGIMSKLESAVGDVYGPNFKEGWLKKMKGYIQHRDSYLRMRAEGQNSPPTA